MSGYPSRAESEHDVVENSHASASLSWAAGIATGRVVSGERDRHTVAVIGDGALTGGMAWEALNNIAAEPDPAARHRRQRQRALLRPDPRRPGRPPRDPAHDPRLRALPRLGQVHPGAHPGRRRGDVRDAARGQEGHQGHRRAAGPVRGPRPEVPRPGRRPRRARPSRRALRKARTFGGPVLVHVLTQKGRGYDPAITDEADQFHAVGVINPETGLPLEIAGRSWTDEFSDEMVRIGERPPRRRRDHRRDDDPGRAEGLLRALPRAHLRRRHRRAARPHHGRRPGLHRPAPRRRRLRDLPQPRLRPAAHGLRHAQGRRHRRARPLRASPAPTAPRTTACGT